MMTGTPSSPIALPKAVLEPVAVVTRDQRGIVDEEAKPRWTRRDLGSIEHPEPVCAPARPGTLLTQLAEKAVQLGGRDSTGVADEELAHLVEQAAQATTGGRRDRRDRWTLAEPLLEPRPHVLDPDASYVPFRQDNKRGAARLPRDVGHGEILIHEPLARVDEDKRDVGSLGGGDRS